MTAERQTLYLVDGPNIAFRAYFAIPGMATSRGFPSNALYGFTNMLLKLVREESPDHLAIVWDPPGKTFRDERYEEYKGTRPDMPDGLSVQMPFFERLADALGIPFVCVNGYEADDVMGTLARRHSDRLDVVLVSSDKDLMQLVGEHVAMLDTMKERRIGVADVIERFGCPPERVADALAIIGDTSDNIPGVKGVGEKGVKKLLAAFDDLEEIYRRIDEVTPPGTRAKLLAARDAAFLSKELATICTDAPVPIELGELALSWPPATDKPRELFSELEFRGLLDQLGGEMRTVDRSRYRLVRTAAELARLCAVLERSPRFAVDTETDGFDSLRANLVGVSVCADDDEAWYVPVGHRPECGPTELDWPAVRAAVGPFLEDPDRGVTGQNLKFDLEVLARHGVELAGIDGDTLLADYLLSPDRRTHKLDELALLHLEHRMISFSDAVGERASFAEVPLEAACEYAAEDAHVAWLLDAVLTSRLEEEGLDGLYRDLEVPLIPVLARMEQAGIAVDLEVLDALGVELEGRIAELEARCWELAGQRFMIGSVKQLRAVLFDRLGLPVVQKTKTGPSTNERVLSELVLHHPLPAAILDYRALVKLKNTYVDPLPGLVDPSTGRVHTSYSQTTAATGRLSSTDPNLQNIPIRTIEGRRIRQAFVAPPGRLLLSADYSQVELRILAHLVGGTGALADAFASGTDVHRETAAGLFGVDGDDVTAEMRSMAKAVNFGIIYGQSAFGLAQTQRIPRGEAAEYIRRYKERFPEIEEYRRRTLDEARRSGAVTTLLGRRRPVPDLASGNFAQRGQAERIAVNTPVQGSAADLIKKAMIAVDRRLADEHPGQRMLLQVHDELVLEVDEERVEEVAAMVRSEMCSALELSVPLVVETGWGRTWDEAH